MKRRMISMSCLALALLITISGCATKVTRVDERAIIDLSGKWNDTDSQMVADEMINSCLAHPWHEEFVDVTGRRPVVIIGTIFNKTHEHISSNTFIRDLERAFVNTGEVRVVQASASRDEVRAERQDQQEFASPETRKRFREELGTDLMLQGTIDSIVDREGNKRVYFYQVDLELIDLQTNEKVWLGQKKLKKYVEKSSLRP